ncbi:winged helix-turn-helix transcriptional regulator [Bergeyella sp. RCAD1439]|uniref:winged helix-turn-helix transcriptional regulator n=1 Tax=Bergeyella anatis TaxID=3113737 RepID=UPI002E193D6C|nr:helix-turn-helix domain-containing protein [Bergeyella sp. RCAD1439]
MIKYRSKCPLCRSLDVFGDKWTLLILRDIGLKNKTTFKELSQMEEGIASNTLSNRLEKMTFLNLLTKTRSKRNKLVFHYNITEKGREILPIINEIIDWSEKHLYKKNETSESTPIPISSKN